MQSHVTQISMASLLVSECVRAMQLEKCGSVWAVPGYTKAEHLPDQDRTDQSLDQGTDTGVILCRSKQTDTRIIRKVRTRRQQR